MVRFLTVRSTISRSFFAFTTPAPLQRISRFGSAMFSRIDSLVHSPSFLRSSGASTIPALIASIGHLMSRGFPSRRTSPPSFGSTPKIARVVSVRPAPISPAMPTISPS